jgi:uncharacterized protein YndB with AHSA1/START domain
MEATTLPAIRKSITVDCPVEEAFRTFTEGAASWWPFGTHSVHGEQAKAVVWEGAGGRVYERGGPTEAVWGEVLVWEPPHRFVTTWHPGRGPEEATELEVRFSPEGDGTRVELEHRGWEQRGREARASYDSGWGTILELYAGSINR